MSSFLRLPFATLCLFLPLTALAADPAPTKPAFRAFTSSISCEQAVGNLDKKAAQSNFALMVSAFITGTNYVKNRDSKVDLKSMMALTEQYCRQNPKQPVTNALIVLDKSIDNRIAMEKKGATAKPK
jgi:hypothetical protein